MTDNDRKALTLFLGECWHEEIDSVEHPIYGILHKCSCGAVECEKSSLHRTFTTWDDLGQVKEALVKKGLWLRFAIYAYKVFQVSADNIPYMGFMEFGFMQWLITPDRFCDLAGEFMEGQHGSK